MPDYHHYDCYHHHNRFIIAFLTITVTIIVIMIIILTSFSWFLPSKYYDLLSLLSSFWSSIIGKLKKLHDNSSISLSNFSLQDENLLSIRSCHFLPKKKISFCKSFCAFLEICFCNKSHIVMKL